MGNFDFLTGVNEALKDRCHDAEKDVKTDPAACASKSRIAMENFVKSILWEKKKPFDKKMELNNLIKLMHTAKQLSPDNCQRLSKARWCYNQFAHENQEGFSKSDTSSPSHKDVIHHFKEFYRVVHEYYTSKNKKNPKGDAEYKLWKAPIGKYQPIKKLKPNQHERCTEKFLCEYEHAGSSKKRYCVIRQFEKRKISDSVLLMREMRVIAESFEEGANKENLVIPIDITTSDTSDYLFTAYNLPKEAQTLDCFPMENLTKTELFQIALGIANGLQELHHNDPPIVHRALSPESIYVLQGTSGYVPRIGNFELCKIYLDDIGTVIGAAAKVQHSYKAPEVIPENKDITSAADIYSFGQILLELLGGSLNYRNAMASLAERGYSESFRQTIDQMVSKGVAKRPSIDQVLTIMKKEEAYHE